MKNKKDFERELISIAKEFLISNSKSVSVKDLPGEFQKEIKSLYQKLKPLSNKTTQQEIVDDLAKKFKPTANSHKLSATCRMFPKLYLKNIKTDISMECTLSSAMLKLELQEKGFKNIYTVLLSGHQIVMQQLKTGGVTVFDVSSRWTDDKGMQHGFLHTYSKNEVKNKKPVYDKKGSLMGFSFTIQTPLKIENTGMLNEPSKEGKGYSKKFFASNPNTLIELAIALDNLNDLADRNNFKYLADFNAQKTIQELEIFNPAPLYK